MEYTETQHNVSARYALCRLGLGLAAVACAIMTIDAAGQASALLTGDIKLFQIFSSPEWAWYAGSVLTWSALVGSLLMVGRWDEPTWRRRTGLLLLISTACVGMWVVRHSDRFGLTRSEAPYSLLRMHLTIGLRWVWMMLLVDLAADVSEHLGLPTVNKDRASARTALLLAVVFWCLLLLVHLPMLLGQHVGPGLFRRTWLPLIGFILTRCAACFLTTIVALAAARECSRILKELRSARLNAEVSTW